MRVCVGTSFPGGPNGKILLPFEDSDLFDFYDADATGRFELTAQTRKCSCSDLIEAAVKRGISAVIVKDLTAPSLLKFTDAGIRVFVTKDIAVKSSLDKFSRSELQELTKKDFGSLGKRRREVV